jgi:dTDP-4-amino-4,6-dideoxygalactose transaminase
MSIFNSLGSNYSFSFSLLALKQLLAPNRQHLKHLEEKLSNKFDDQVKLVWKGRDAIELCLASYGIGQGDQVLTQALTCHSVEEAVKRTGAEVVYTDVEPNQVRLDFDQFKQTVSNHSDIKAVIVQHTLGYPDQVGRISDFCQQQDILLIEDLAQSLGGEDYSLEKLGSRADALILSFGRDKIVDGISGGAVVFRKPVEQNLEIPFALPSSKPKQVRRARKIINQDLFYPVLTWLIRKTYGLGLGQLIHYMAQKLGWFYSPVKSNHQHYCSLPAYYAPLIEQSYDQLERNINHRRKLAHYYLNQLSQLESVELMVDREQVSRGTNLRLPILVENPASLIKFLKKRGIYLSDRWYKQAVDAGSTNQDSVYQANSCPQAEQVAQKIINLPTHQEVNLSQAEQISASIKNWAEDFKERSR